MQKPIPRWVNLYGPPLSSKGMHAEKMTLFLNLIVVILYRYGETMGSHFRGRILFSATSYWKEDPKTIIKQL